MKEKILKLIYRFLANCGHRYTKRHKPFVIGITGSVGKTSCRMIVKQVLNRYLGHRKIYTSPKNFNSEIGLVFSVFKIETYSPGIFSLLWKCSVVFVKSFSRKKQYDILVLEYGVDHPGDMDALLRVVKPDISIFTKLDKIHGVYFDSPNGIGDEKIKLMQDTKKRVYMNAQDEFSQNMLPELKIKQKSFFSEAKNISLENKKHKVLSKFSYDDAKIETNLLGKENLDYISLAFDILKDEFHKTIRDGKIKIVMQPWRCGFLQGISNSVLIDSTYNAGPASMKKMIENTFTFRGELFSDYKVLLVLWEMRELGNISNIEHQKLANEVSGAEGVYLVGNDMKALQKELKKQNFQWDISHSLSAREIGKKLRKYISGSNDKYIILFKGSQNTIFTEEALKEVLLEKKDVTHLVRQSKDWMQKKELFFKK